mgnify:CR=1 FL=1
MIYPLKDYPSVATDVLAFQKEFTIGLFNTVYYPCSAHDASLFFTLKESRVIHVDTDKNVIETLHSIGAEAYEHSVLDFELFTETGKKADFLHILNPQVVIDEHFIENCLNIGGYCMCNNYHKTAEQVGTVSTMKSLGVMKDGVLLQETMPEIFKKIAKYRIDTPVSMFTPYMDHRFLFQKTS